MVASRSRGNHPAAPGRPPGTALPRIRRAYYTTPSTLSPEAPIRVARFTPLAALALAACASAPAPLAREPELRAVPVTGHGYNNETSIAIDPTDPSRVAVAWQVPATVAWSTDGGGQWHPSPLPGLDRFELAGDPIVTFDADGRLYAFYIAFDRPADYDTLGKAAHRNGIFVNRSDDGGRTWMPEAVPVIFQEEAPGIPFEDKPMATVDRSDDPARRGTLHIAWTQFRRWETGILYSRSADHGLSWSEPVEISDVSGSPKDTVGALEGTDVVVGPDGTVHVVWSDSVGIRYDRSTDGGRTWGTDVLIAPTPDIVFAVPGVARANGFPNLEADPVTGRLYVQWVDGRLGHLTPFLSTSDDGGRSWSEPRAIAGTDDDADRFFAWTSVDPGTGLVAVGYYREEAPGEYVYVLAASTDRGRSFRERTWSRAPFRPAGAFLGDYTGIDAYDGVVHAAWTEAAPLPAAEGERVHTTRHNAQVWAGRAVFR